MRFCEYTRQCNGLIRLPFLSEYLSQTDYALANTLELHQINLEMCNSHRNVE